MQFVIVTLVKKKKRYKKKEVLAADFHINFATDNCINENTQKKY